MQLVDFGFTVESPELANFFGLWKFVYKGLLSEAARKFIPVKENASYRGSRFFNPTKHWKSKV